MSDYEGLSEKYRRGKGTKSLTLSEKYAYLTARLPATLAAILEVLKEISIEIEELLDLGAGPATGLLAAREVFPYIRKAILVERDREMVSLGKELIQAAEPEWIIDDLARVDFPASQLGLMAYVLNELEDPAPILERAFEACQILALIEPGTPQGFERILRAREQLIALGGSVVAPCPHSRACPMKAPDWCHFSARVSRTREHRQAKGGDLGYEDEKFSYVIIGKGAASKGAPRILGRPQLLKGHVKLKLCTEEGLKEETVAKKAGPLYKRARKSKWGDLFSKDVIEDREQESEE
jgi:ribosomal protein RSM22 (predicted rRNA methylase)